MIENKYEIIVNKDTQVFTRFPFEIPEGIEKMEVEYSYSPERPETGTWRNQINLAILDNEGNDVGTRGSQIRKLTISPNYSTDGFDRRVLVPGTWYAVIGIGRILTDEVSVELTVRLYEKEARWRAGDTHVHSVHSDGKYRYEELAKKAVKNGLEYLFITDHNRTVIGELPSEKGLTMVDGIEITYDNGHSNFWGLKKPFSGTYAVNTFEEWCELREQAEKNGALISINHPNCMKCPWRWQKEGFNLNSVEVWSGPMRPDNLRAIEWWDNELKKGRKLPMVGGSDYHRDYVVTNFLGLPATYIYSEGASKEDLLEGIRKGRTSVSERANDTFISIESDGKMIGDTLEFTGANKATITVKKLHKGHTLRVIDNDGVVLEYKAKKGGDYTFDVDVRRAGYLRAEVTYKPNFIHKFILDVMLSIMLPGQGFKKLPPLVYALCSPIYFD